MAQLLLRTSGVNQPIVSIPHPVLGNCRRSGVSFIYTEEGRSVVRINRFGFRDREHALPKMPGTFRIGILGDSYAEAYQVEQSSTFWALLEGALNDCEVMPGRVEVLNVGVSGYGTAQEFIMLRKYALAFSPDVAILPFLTGNDIRSNSRRLEPSAAVRPFFYIHEADRLMPDMSFRRSEEFAAAEKEPWRRLRLSLDEVRLIQMLGLARTRSRGLRAADALAPILEQGLDKQVYVSEASPDWADAWLVAERLVKAMAMEAEAHGARFLVVSLSNGIQVHPDKRITEAFLQQRGLEGIFYSDRRLADFGRREGIEVLLLAPALQSIARATRAYMHGFGERLGTGHWNEQGHRHAAWILASALCKGFSPVALPPLG